MQDLFQALAMLDKGVTKYATSRAINDANDQVSQLNQSEMDEGQKIQSLREVANGLTRRLAGLGADASTIQLAAGSIEPPKAPLIQSPFQAIIAGLNPNIPADAKKIQAAGKDVTEQANEMKLLLAHQKEETKKKDSQLKAGDAAIKDFPKFAKQELEAFNAAELSTADFANKDNLSKTLALKALIKASGDPRPSDQDMADAVPQKSLWAGVKRMYSEYLAGKPLEGDAQIIEGTVTLLKKKAAGLATKKVKGYANQHGRRHGLDPAQLEQDILSTHMPSFAGAPAQQMQQAPAPAPAGGGSYKRFLE